MELVNICERHINFKLVWLKTNELVEIYVVQ